MERDHQPGHRRHQVVRVQRIPRYPDGYAGHRPLLRPQHRRRLCQPAVCAELRRGFGLLEPAHARHRRGGDGTDDSGPDRLRRDPQLLRHHDQHRVRRELAGGGRLRRPGLRFPLLNASGVPTGICLPTGADPCYNLSGSSVPTPAGMTDVISGSDAWNGPAVTVNARVYVPNGNTNNVACYDYAASAGCANFPVSFDNLGYALHGQRRPAPPDLPVGERRQRVQPDPELRRLHRWLLRDLPGAHTGRRRPTAAPRRSGPRCRCSRPTPRRMPARTSTSRTPVAMPFPVTAAHTWTGPARLRLTDLNMAAQYALPEFVAVLHRPDRLTNDGAHPICVDRLL